MNWYGALRYDLTGYDVIMTRKNISKASVKKLGRGVGGYIAVMGPYENQQEVTKVIRRTKLPVVHSYQYPKPNPPKDINTHGAIEIYDRIQAIEAKKGRRSLWPQENFRHDFRRKGAKVFGLRNGNLLVVGKKPLWKMFKYPKDVSDYG